MNIIKGITLTNTSNKNKKLLVLCNGPSIQALVDWGFHNLPNDIDTVATSLAYRYFEEINWWPTYYALGDPKVLLHHQKAFQSLISDPNIPIKKFYLATKCLPLDINITFFDPFNRVVETTWQVTGQIAFKVGFRHNYDKIYLLGCDNKYYWDHSLVKPLSSDFDMDNRAIILEDVVKNPNYGIPNYLRKGDITSWLFQHPNKSYSTTDLNHCWQELISSTQEKEITVIDFSFGNIPAPNKRNDFKAFIESTI